MIFDLNEELKFSIFIGQYVAMIICTYNVKLFQIIDGQLISTFKA